MRKTVPSRFGDLEAVRAKHDRKTVDMLTASVFETDTDADALVKVFAELPGGAGWQMFDQLLRNGVDAVPEAPAELLTVVADALLPPDWVDFDRVGKGAIPVCRMGGRWQLRAGCRLELADG